MLNGICKITFQGEHKMSQAIIFDTYENVKQLKAVGFTEEQAEVQTRTIANLVDNQLATKIDLEKHQLATKRDMKELEIATRHDLEKHQLATKRDLKELELSLKHDLTIRMGGMLTAFVAIIAVLIKVF